MLRYVGKKEGFDVPDKIAHDIAEDANGNLRKALLVLEALKMQSSVPPPSLPLRSFPPPPLLPLHPFSALPFSRNHR